MHETPGDLRALQRLLDDSRARAGAHLRSVFAPVTEMTAGEIVDEARGVCVLNLATVTARCTPLVAPVDGLFFRGRFHFGTSPEAVRARHLRARPQVSAAYTRGEELTVVVHGTAVEIDVSAPDAAPFRSYLLEVYPDWEQWYAGEPAPYWRIEPERMYAARTSRLTEQARDDG